MWRFKLLLSGLELQGGRQLPTGFGKSWYLMERDVIVCHPVPLNWIFGAARAIWIFLRRGPRERYIERAYKRGFKEGTENREQFHKWEIQKIKADAYVEGRSSAFSVLDDTMRQLLGAHYNEPTGRTDRGSGEG